MSWKKFVEQCDLDLRQGRTRAVAQRLGGLSVAAVDREWRLPLATICRRANLFTTGLKLLTPLIYSDRNKWRSEATPAERSEYAALLSKNGNNLEALKILEGVSGFPEATLYTAFCHMANWDYDQAAAELKKYLPHAPSLYSQTVATVNLGSCWVAMSEWALAHDLLANLIGVATENNYGRLLGNILELRGQAYLRQRQWKSARKDLEKAEKLLSLDGTSDQLFVSKWKAILGGFENKSVESILNFRGEAERRGHWESVRDADRFALILDFDEWRFHHLLFGTPFASFRNQLSSELGRSPSVSVVRLGVEGGESLDIATGASTNGELAVSPQLLHLITVLTTDFYRPIRLGALFSSLFPNEIFNIYSSPNRVHQTLWRARKWIAEANLPLRILEMDGNYKLEAAGKFSLLVPLNRPCADSRWLEPVRANFGNSEFAAAEACAVLSISRSAFLRRAKASLARGDLIARFKGSGVRYRVK